MYEVNVAMAQLLLSAGHAAIRAMDSPNSPKPPKFTQTMTA